MVLIVAVCVFVSSVGNEEGSRVLINVDHVAGDENSARADSLDPLEYIFIGEGVGGGEVDYC